MKPVHYCVIGSNSFSPLGKEGGGGGLANAIFPYSCILFSPSVAICQELYTLLKQVLTALCSVTVHVQ